MTWLTSAKVHLAVLHRPPVTSRCASRRLTLPDYQTFLKKFLSERKLFVDDLNNVKHVRPNIPDYAGCSQRSARWCSRLAARPGPARRPPSTSASERSASVLAGGS